MNGDRYYINDSIRIKKATVSTLKNMNNSYITKSEDFDYRFLVYLLDDVFDKQTLETSSVYTKKTNSTKFSALDRTKLGFIKGNVLATIHIKKILLITIVRY